MRYLFIAALMLNAAGATFAQTAFKASDVRVELTISGSKFRVGEPIPYEVKATNLSKTDLSYTDCTRYIRIVPDHSMQVLDKTGKELPHLGWNGEIDIPCGIGALRPGASFSLRSYLNQWVLLDKPGTYTVCASWRPDRVITPPAAPPKSAPVRVEIVAASQSERDDFLQEGRKRLASAKSQEAVQDAIWILEYTLDTRAVPDLLRASHDVYVSEDAGMALGRFPDQEAVREALVKELKDNGPYDALAYEIQMCKPPASEMLPLLKSWVQKGTADQRSAALHALFMIPEKYKDESLKVLILAQLKDPDPNVRKNALTAIAGRGYADTIDVVMDIARNDKDLDVRRQAASVLGWYWNDKAIPPLKQMAKEQDSPLANNAVMAIANLNSPAAFAALREIASGEAGPGKKAAQEELKWRTEGKTH